MGISELLTPEEKAELLEPEQQSGEHPTAIPNNHNGFAVTCSQETPMARLPEAAWSGPFGQWRDTVAPCTEAPHEFLYASFLVALGMMLGRNVWRSTPRPIYPNFYVLLLGQTGDSRKSTSLWFAEELLRHVGEDVQIITGIVSTEGLIERLAQEEGTKGLGYVDELRSLMSVGKRMGTQDLLPKLNSLYYCPAHVSVDRVKNPTTAIRPFFSLIGATVQDYVDDLIGGLELNGGFLNRFLLVSGEEKPPNPDAEEPSERDWLRMAAPLIEVRDHWAGNPTKMEWSDEAKELWREFYVQWKTERKTWHPTAQKLTARTHEHVQKLACVYAAVNGKGVIPAKSLATAISVGGWLESSALHLFGDVGLDPFSKAERDVLNILSPKGRMWRRDLQQLASKKGINGELFGRVLKSLESNDHIYLDYEKGISGQKRPYVEYVSGNR